MPYKTTDESPYLFFYGPKDHPYAILSQWHPSPFTTPSGITYHTAEQYMMHQKALLFNDTVHAEQIIATKSPKLQKELGRQVEGFTNEIWDANRERIVEEGSYYKFKNGRGADGELLRERLLATADKVLVEAAANDRIWGIGYNEKHALAGKSNWGLNLLGKALMKARERLREEDEKEEESVE